ncbi:MAG: DNA double-strand break repair nuclease NurA [Nitrososphaerota archaeon]|nr:DNA double-strand break repair nuclease NurA [Candidatus Bathyarchaeota archaeon]MDW8061744.1 DNA double-strand break repair nuclease NurA [Nitrososphaerota archaeon]
MITSDTTRKLRDHTLYLLDIYRSRVEKLKDAYDLVRVTKNLDVMKAVDLARKFFGKGRFRALGIDGSMRAEERLEMLLFYVCASGYSCTFEVSDSHIDFHIDTVLRDETLSFSTAIPLWFEDISSIATIEELTDAEIDINRFIDKIPNAFMALAEIYTAYKAASPDKSDIKILLLDKSIYSTYSYLSVRVKKLISIGRSALEGLETRYGNFTITDLLLSFMFGSGDIYIPHRQSYLQFHALKLIMDEGPISWSSIKEKLNISSSSEDWILKKLRTINKRCRGTLFVEDRGLFYPSEDSRSYWPRSVEAALNVASKLLEGRDYPLIIEDRWVRLLDWEAITFIILQALIDLCVKDRKLLIGIAKDTTATDLTRSTIPYMKLNGELDPSTPIPSLKSDRALLSILSAERYNDIKTPWRTVAYDACFSTLFHPPGFDVMKAARKRVGRERLFAKSYFQLREFSSDPKVRTLVFLYDRPIYLEDLNMVRRIEIEEASGRASIEPFYEGVDGLSLIDNLILYILSMMDEPQILEATGHNKLLYIADKAVKAEANLAIGLLKGVADIHLESFSRKMKTFYLSRSFREYRRESEYARRLVSSGKAD